MGEGIRAVAVLRSLQRRAGQSTTGAGMSCCPENKEKEQLITCGKETSPKLLSKGKAEMFITTSSPELCSQMG